MYFNTSLLLSLTLAISSLALPMTGTPDDDKVKRAGVLTVQDYADFQVSDGIAGNALAEVQAKFPIDETNLANVASTDLAIIKAARVTAESAETDTGGFNDAISAAGGTSTTAGAALQVGKIKNKVLKLKLEVLGLQIDQAQSGTDNTAEITAETTKLNSNIALDKKAAGQTSQSVDFQGDDSP
ncbi:hypothetical protein QBC46DRAFT_379322 [Diplogelasinospora grovesii]|uniref:Small secreted protein n=1 Tax=Diplogelasinospora grovesii TaxID=303347 RepID=A0AAN6NBJ9_9PEZI|nr:hypothetical protein QBC46DRAFT_379322 [Diplogelasinospora grovesii]